MIEFGELPEGWILTSLGDDEPASVLLERIRTERAQLDTKTKTAKKSPSPASGDRRKKAKPQDAEPVQLELGLE
ncbi:hypothetical protein SD81_023095 [Tolypothrix campylonemoides VB511288]|nr:hypothetical protein SD81_023095 [Tolypothrix campylonemoides VB511288]